MASKESGLTALPVILCKRTKETQEAIADYAEKLREAAFSVGNHGMTQDEFWSSGLFRSAIERLRGQQAAAMAGKRDFVAGVLNYLRVKGEIQSWTSSGSADRHDYELHLASGRIAVIEAKGCLDGNNTNIFERPPNADEFIIWSLCQNPGADPRHNAWSGIHTRLSAEIIHRRQRVDGLIIWDMVCGTLGRPCPKIAANKSRTTLVRGQRLPPPCVYVFPRSVPDPRSNPSPRCWKLSEVESLEIFHRAFKGDANDVVEVQIEAGMKGATIRRTTRLLRNGEEIVASKPTPIQRANR